MKPWARPAGGKARAINTNSATIEMTTTVFFSWQADTETRGGRNFIETALKRAAAQISKNTEVEEAVRELAVDRDTVGVAGSPPIVDTIFRKIDQAVVFVPDFTFIGKRLGGRPTPNPNVLVEYGWALKSIGHGRIVPIMNTAYGEPISDAMPFNMRHLRNPIAYHCPPGLDDDSRKQVRDQLAKELESAIRAVLDSDEFKSSLPKPKGLERFQAREAVDGRGRFKPVDEPIGIASRGGFDGPRKMFLSTHPAIWFRLMPSLKPSQKLSVATLDTAIRQSGLHPLTQAWASYGYLRSNEGCGLYGTVGDDRETARAIVFAFTTGELWSAETYWLEANIQDGRKIVPNMEESFRRSLMTYSEFLLSLGIKPLYIWMAGMEDIKDRDLYVPAPPGHTRYSTRPNGTCIVDVVAESGAYSPGDPPGATLKPFFTELYNSCGVLRQDWQDK
jgi:hypothetical protein